MQNGPSRIPENFHEGPPPNGNAPRRAAARNGRAKNELIKRITFKDKNGRVVEEKDVVTYAGLLSKAHDEGLKRIATKVVQIPSDVNGHTAVIVAEVETAAGVFAGIGDANPQNVKPKIVPHLIRMAETRAKARALRDAVNVGVLALEELVGTEGPDDEFVPTEPQPRQRRPAVTQHTAAPPQNPPQASPPSTSVNNAPPRQAAPPALQPQTRPAPDDGVDPMTEKQRRYLFRLLAARGIEAEGAQEKLRRVLNVRDLRQASKSAASELIDRLVADTVSNELGGGAPS